MPALSLGQQIVLNSATNLGRYALSVPVFFFLTPYILTKLGDKQFGVWVLIATFMSFADLGDLGMRSALRKYYAEDYAQRDYEALSADLSTATLIFIPLSLFILGAVYLGLDAILRALFAVDPSHQVDLRFVFLVALTVFAVSFCFTPYLSILEGLQRFDILNGLNSVSTLLHALAAVWVLQAGWGLKGLILSQAGISLLSLSALLWVTYRLVPQARFHRNRFRWKSLEKILQFGAKIFTSSLANVIHFQVDKILLASFVGVGAVGHYQIAASLAGNIRSIPQLVLEPVMPAASALEKGKGAQTIERLYHLSQKYNATLSFPLTAGLLLFGHPFVDLWLGPGYSRVAFTLQILSLGYLVNILSGPGFSILNGTGRPQYGVYSSLLAAFLNLTLGLILVIQFGYYGVVMATFLSMVIAAGFFKWAFHRVSGIPFDITFQQIFLPPFLSAGVASGLCAALLYNLPAGGLFRLAGIISGFVVAYLLLLILCGYIRKDDSARLWQALAMRTR